jgi:hypothetical protein
MLCESENARYYKMNELVRQYFREGVHFEKVIFLSDSSEMHWSDITQMVPDFPRGWFELSRISVENRLHFTYDFWLDRLPFHAKVYPALGSYFEKLDDIGAVLIRNHDLWNVELIYSLRDNSSFFRGAAPASLSDIEEVKMSLRIPLPRDYLAFMKIHNGFGRLSEMGLLKVDELMDAKRHLMDLILKSDQPIKSGLNSVDPTALCPFYEVSGLDSFQCFYADWYPGSEVGNVFFSGIDYTVSDTSQQNNGAENFAFPTFLEWLICYLDGMSISP